MSLTDLTLTPWPWIAPAVVPHLVPGSSEMKPIHSWSESQVQLTLPKWCLTKLFLHWMVGLDSLISYCSSQHALLHSTVVFSCGVLGVSCLHCVCSVEPILSHLDLAVRKQVQFLTSFFCAEICLFLSPVGSNSPFRLFLDLRDPPLSLFSSPRCYNSSV